MERYIELSEWERKKRKRQGQANFLYVRYAADCVVVCDGTREQAEALGQELQEFLRIKLKRELSMEKTKVTHISEGFEFLGFLIDRGIVGSGKWAPRIRIPTKSIEKVRGKIRAALAPDTHKDSVKIRIIGLNRVIGGWCRYYQTTSSPSRDFNHLGYEVYWSMAHWLGRKYQMSIPRVIRTYGREDTFGTGKDTLVRADEFKAKRHRLRKIGNPYLSNLPIIQREKLDRLEEAWSPETRKGIMDLKEVVY